MKPEAQILAIGDVHLGTACSGLPDGLSGWGIDRSELTPAAALRKAVDFALEKKVDAVLFAGDVVESANARFEAMVPLERSVRALADHGIQVIAVAGNHDVEALPRLARLIEGFTLLGAGGHWEGINLMQDGNPFAQVIGWSFPEKRVRLSPVALLLREPLPPPTTPVPRIGLLHADLGASGGHYAPIRQAELDDTGYDAWLLGHIHKPSLKGLSAAGGARPRGYLGSLVGLDSSETGPHGPWLLTVSNDGGIAMEQVPLSPVRWEHVPVPVDGIEDAEDVPDRLLVEARNRLEKLARAGPLPRALGLQVRLTGSSDANEEIRNWIRKDEWKSIVRVVDDTVVFLNRIVDAMELQLDLETLAAGDDPAALLAQRLLWLGEDNEQSWQVLASARQHLAGIAGQDVWRPVQEHRNATDPISDDALRDILLRSGKAALSAMLSGRE